MKNYQLATFNRMLSNDRIFLYWGRRYGKTYLITQYIKHIINNNQSNDILCLSNNKRESKYLMNFIIDQAYFYIKKINTRTIFFKNDNYIEFVTDNLEYNLRRMPDFIIYDDIYTTNDFLSNHINYNRSNCKCIFTSSNLNLDTLQFYDYFNDFYVDIIPGLKNIENKLFYKPKELVSCGNLVFEREEKLKKIKKVADGI